MTAAAPLPYRTYETDPDARLTDPDRDFIHGVALAERALLRATPGDRVVAVCQFGTLVGTVSRGARGHPGGANPAVVLDTPDGNADLTVDYEGAFTSYFDWYAPYVCAGAGTESVGEVVTLCVNGAEIVANIVTFD